MLSLFPRTKLEEDVMTDVAFESWAILELMGHRQRPGLVREVELAGTKMLRVDIHGEDETIVTEFYGGSSVYALRPVTEEIARDAAKRLDLRPVRPVEYRERSALPRPSFLDEGED
jgi:hypothetical protein